MDIAINVVSRVLGTYQNQAKIAELVKESNIKVAQSQEDRVTISKSAREMMSRKEPVKEAHTATAPVSRAASSGEDQAVL